MERDLRELVVVLRERGERAVRFDQFQTANALQAVADSIVEMLDRRKRKGD